MLESLRELPIIGGLLSRPILAAVVVVILVIAAIGIASVSDYSTEGAGEGPGSTAQWLTVHYVSMDNNLDAFGEWQADLHSLEMVGSSPESHHVALYDGEEDGDTVVQYVLEGGVDEMPATEVDPEWGPEVNLGDPAVLTAFVVWAYEEYPAEKITLVLCVAGFAAGLVMCTQSGFQWIVWADHACNDIGLPLVMFLQCVVVGWLFGVDRLRKHINEVSEIGICR